jgi:hypothetical protein
MRSIAADEFTLVGQSNSSKKRKSIALSSSEIELEGTCIPIITAFNALRVLGVNCGHHDCYEKATTSKVYKIKKNEVMKAWCNNHKWCSKCHKYELVVEICAKLVKSNNDVSISRSFSPT